MHLIRMAFHNLPLGAAVVVCELVTTTAAAAAPPAANSANKPTINIFFASDDLSLTIDRH